MALTKAQERQKQKQIEYWTEREEEATKRRITEEKAYERELQKIYDNMLDNVQKEIDAFYGKYAKQNNITLAEAKKAVSELDIKDYERKAKRYVKDKDFSKEANEEMRLYNLTMKVNRLEMLKANIGLELISGHDELQKYMEGVLKGRTMEELERQAGILGKTIRNNAQTANAIVNASFHNAKFSDRIWMHQDLLKSDLNKLLQSGLIAGKNPRVLAREIKSRFGVKIADAERLMRTELARVQTEAQKQSFEANGFTQYIFLALGDACDICKDIDENHYNVEDMKPGLNAPPMHPHCRCSTAAYEDDDEYNAWLEYLENGGTTEEWEKTAKAKWEASQKYKDLSFMEKKEAIYNNEQQIKKLREQMKAEEMEMMLAFDIDEMQAHQAKVLEFKKKIGELEGENDMLNSMLGLPQNAKERFYSQKLKADSLPCDIREDEEGAIGAWSRTDYTFINRFLRHNDKGVRPQSILNANILKKCLDRNVVKEPMTVKRGCGTKYLDNLFGSDAWRKKGFNAKGKVIVDPGFCATTPFDRGGFGGDVQMFIDVPPGAKGAYIEKYSGAPDEKEFLLQCGTHFEIERVEVTYDKWGEPHYEVHARVIVDE